MASISDEDFRRSMVERLSQDLEDGRIDQGRLKAVIISLRTPGRRKFTFWGASRICPYATVCDRAKNLQIFESACAGNYQSCKYC